MHEDIINYLARNRAKPVLRIYQLSAATPTLGVSIIFLHSPFLVRIQVHNFFEIDSIYLNIRRIPKLA